MGNGSDFIQRACSICMLAKSLLTMTAEVEKIILAMSTKLFALEARLTRVGQPFAVTQTLHAFCDHWPQAVRYGT